MALGFFAFDSRGPRVLNGVGAPRPGQRRLERRLIVQFAFDELNAGSRECLGGIALGIARQATDCETFASQRPRRGAALLAR